MGGREGCSGTATGVFISTRPMTSSNMCKLCECLFGVLASDWLMVSESRVCTN